MGNAVINIEFLCGISLCAAVEEAERLYKQLGCSLRFNFNGVKIFYYGQSYAKVNKEYMEALGK